MKTYLRAVVAASVGVVLLVGPAGAQPFDHLKCHKVKDPHKIKGTFDPSPALQPDFEDQGCKIAKAKLFCVPTEKNNVQTQPPPLFPGLGGQDLTNDFLCYRVKCPSLPPDTVVTDQFIDRTLTKMKTQFFCTPAYKGGPPTTTTTTTTTTTSTTTTTMGSNPCSVDPAGMCDGVCPIQGDKCLHDPATGICDCQPQSAQCAYDSVTGTCGGLCMNTNENCVADPPGTNNCTCLPLCADATLPTCAGTCPGTQTCIKDPTTTFCLCCGTGFTSCTVTADCCVPFTCVAGLCQ